MNPKFKIGDEVFYFLGLYNMNFGKSKIKQILITAKYIKYKLDNISDTFKEEDLSEFIEDIKIRAYKEIEEGSKKLRTDVDAAFNKFENKNTFQKIKKINV